MNTHFIAIGGSAMHNLAIALSRKGYRVTGSDDEIFEPSASRLEKQGILPAFVGWDVNNIHSELDEVVLGMHARADNPELLRAQELGLRIYSYPEYLYEQTKNKLRVVIGGSHGKTTITAMILHVLNDHNIDCDYMVGAQLDGFDCMVKLTDEAPVAVFEGDEYLSSPIDRRPKFHLYQPEIALLSGISWDHINVFPTFDIYLEQFNIFIRQIPESGALVYCSEDQNLNRLIQESPPAAAAIRYGIPAYRIEDGITFLTSEAGADTRLNIFGRHNLMNLNGARVVCERLGVPAESFFQAIASFKGAANRLELIKRVGSRFLYKDFAHAPSKVAATVAAAREQFPDYHLTACLELHTFSSLNESFLTEYNGTLKAADEGLVYFNPHTIEHKKLAPVTVEQVRRAFGGDHVQVFTDSEHLVTYLKAMHHTRQVFLMMSSGNFDGLDFHALSSALIGKKR